MNIPAHPILKHVTSHGCHYYQNTTSFFVVLKQTVNYVTTANPKMRREGNSKPRTADLKYSFNGAYVYSNEALKTLIQKDITPPG